MLLKLDIYSQIILRKILKHQKENDNELAECFRDTEVIDNIINQIDASLKEDKPNENSNYKINN